MGPRRSVLVSCSKSVRVLNSTERGFPAVARESEAYHTKVGGAFATGRGRLGPRWGASGHSEANANAFTAGWFRTGDQGFLDDDGYLVITGRLKEIVNRGGEKISPRAVDEVLPDHPPVAQAVTLAVPHEKLGEEVAGASREDDAFAESALGKTK